MGRALSHSRDGYSLGRVLRTKIRLSARTACEKCRSNQESMEFPTVQSEVKHEVKFSSSKSTWKTSGEPCSSKIAAKKEILN